MNGLWSYCISIEGHLTDDWSEWFDGIQISRLPNGQSQLITAKLDQAALYAILFKVNQKGLRLVKVERITPETPR